MIRRLEVFVAVAEELSFTSAAEKLRMPQPWLSTQLKKLEEEIELQLISRSTRNVCLTENGAALYELAKAVSTSLDNFKVAAQHIRKQRPPLHIGTDFAVSACEIRNKIVSTLMKDYADIDFKVVSGLPDELFGKLEAKELDAVIAPLPAPEYALDVITLYNYNISLLIPCNHPLARLNPIPLEMLRGYDVISMNKGYHSRASKAIGKILSDYEIRVIPAPDADHFSRIELIRALGAPSFWVSFDKSLKPPKDLLERRITAPVLQQSLAAMRLSGQNNPSCDIFWNIARSLSSPLAKGLGQKERPSSV